MRAAALVAACSLAALAPASVKLRILQNGVMVGDADYGQRIESDGGKVVELRMRLKREARTVEVLQTSRFDRDGMPLRIVQDLRTARKRRLIVVTFDDRGAQITTETDGESRTRRVELAPGVSRGYVPEFWFLRDQPTPGTQTRGYQFSLDLLDWELADVRYVGLVRRGDAAYHRVRTQRGDRVIEALLDEYGEPIVLDDGAGFRMERMVEAGKSGG